MAKKPISNPTFPVDITWKDVFDASKKNWRFMGRKGARAAGYAYFCYRDKVYHTETGNDTYVYMADISVNGARFIGFKYDILLLQKHWIGKKVTKVSGKPFKSKQHVNTVKDVMSWNEYSKVPSLNKPAFVFEEDTSWVECLKCE